MIDKIEVPRSSLKDIGITVTGEEAETIIEMCDEYLSHFAAGSKCPKCGSALGGLLGSFQWGIVHGEGECKGGLHSEGPCGWPCRARHVIKDKEGDPIFSEALPIVLAYHPDYVTKKAKDAE